MSEGPSVTPSEATTTPSNAGEEDLATAIRAMRDAENAATKEEVKDVEHALKERYGGRVNAQDLLDVTPDTEEESEPETE